VPDPKESLIAALRDAEAAFHRDPGSRARKRALFQLLQQSPAEDALKKAYYVNWVHTQHVRSRFPTRTVLALVYTALCSIGLSFVPVGATLSSALWTIGTGTLGTVGILYILWRRWYRFPMVWLRPWKEFHIAHQPVLYYLVMSWHLFWCAILLGKR
jgi:hypothetical protein